MGCKLNQLAELNERTKNEIKNVKDVLENRTVVQNGANFTTTDAICSTIRNQFPGSTHHPLIFPANSQSESMTSSLLRPYNVSSVLSH